jgi:hypothetical protein
MELISVGCARLTRFSWKLEAVLLLRDPKALQTQDSEVARSRSRTQGEKMVGLAALTTSTGAGKPLRGEESGGRE